MKKYPSNNYKAEIWNSHIVDF